MSNLVVDQTEGNPAAVAAAGGALPDAAGTLPIPNVATDTGLSAPFNSLFTIFGQFFDHGLDLTTKGGGTVMMPLKPDDPLFVPGSPTNFMVLTRATNQPGPDGITGDRPGTAVDESADDVQEATNTTTSFVDQNQTYTSHPSHQVFLREFTRAAGGPTVDTGRLLGGEGGEGLATWAHRQGPGPEQARHRPDGHRRVERAAAGHRPVRQLPAGTERLPPAGDRHRAGRGQCRGHRRPGQRHPDRARVPRRHRPPRGADGGPATPPTGPARS